MYGQMTAGSWIYIGTQGIVQGTYETFVEVGRQHYGGDLAGKWILTGGPRRHGRRAAAGRDHGRRLLPRRRMPAEPHRVAPAHPLSRRARPTTLDEALAMIDAACKARRSRSRSACSAMPPRSSPSWSAAASAPDVVTDQTSAHDPINGYLPKGWTLAEWERAARAATRRRWSKAAKRSMARACRAPCWTSTRRACRRSTTATTSARWRRRRASTNAFDFPGFVPAYIRPLFCRGIGPFRWAALSGDPEDIYRTDAEGEGAAAGQHASAQLARHGARAHPLPGPAGAHLLGRPRRPAPAGPRLQRDGGQGRAQGAGRDRPRPSRFRLGRLAQPRDRSDAGRLRRGVRLAAAQRAAQHAPRAPPGCRCTMAAASAWASRSIPAWSSSPTARRRPPGALERVLWNDPATGVMRHADAGYEIALDCAREHQLNLPGILG